ncbi:MAG: DCC1-like thiol-disulfide oxidoreductase family protein, partial [Spirochaetia bacterium]|nr:DCC1-like thiol-disulfide oxidoreductase family protein [Spirochaetia bacterium]
LSFSFKRKTISVKNWQMPGMIFYGAWLIMAAGYTISGIHKLGSPSWIDGSAVLHLLHNPLARDTFIRGFILEAPVWFFNVLSWSALFLEIAFLPLAAFRKTRWIAWTGIVFMHLGILTVVNFADLTAGVLMIHLFTVDPLWFPSRKFAKNKNPPVIYFDGFCILCNGFVDFLLEEDKSHLYRFSALQSEAAKSALSGIGKIPDSVVLYDNGNLYFRSDAAIKIISSLGGIWKILVVFYLVPRFLRDPVYDFIAKSRYTWFGKKDSCRIPSDEEKQYFIDS